jgi:hypothetical protein
VEKGEREREREMGKVPQTPGSALQHPAICGAVEIRKLGRPATPLEHHMQSPRAVPRTQLKMLACKFSWFITHGPSLYVVSPPGWYTPQQSCWPSSAPHLHCDCFESSSDPALPETNTFACS